MTLTQSMRLAGYRVQQSARGIRLRFEGTDYVVPIQRQPPDSRQYEIANDERERATLQFESAVLPSSLVKGSYIFEVENTAKKYRVLQLDSPTSDVLTSVVCEVHSTEE